MWSSSKPMARNVSHLGRLAEVNTSRPQCLANWTAARPTPPVAAWIRIDWPGCTSASSRSAVVRRGEHDERGGGLGVGPAGRDGRTRRASAWTTVPVPSGNRPITRSPTAKSVTPSPTSITTPAPSLPSSASWVNMPSVIITSRKLAATACHLDADVPGAQRLLGVRNLFQREVVERPGGGDAQPPRLARGRRLQHRVGAATAHHARDVGDASPQHDLWLADGQDGRRRRTSPIASTRTMRPGFSVCAARTRPHTAAPARSVTSSPGRATAPWVTTTRVGGGRLGEPGLQPVLQARGAPSVCVARRGIVGIGCGAKRIRRPCGRRSGAAALRCGDGRPLHLEAVRPRGLACPTSASCSALTGRVVIAPTESTGRPSPSARSMDTEFGPTGAIRARTEDAPAACSDDLLPGERQGEFAADRH